ncbi:vesicular inhibitory amino acid transporter [Electrophorus electricus]|uniref:vesicular inhibitory amino acid transporter n=1 Tax=Electrophorus electricus TaxID=8005 RepID=UPI0015D04212|nr:vesicular inhibitory amino acid transporter [Electrophorus electricus]
MWDPGATARIRAHVGTAWRRCFRAGEDEEEEEEQRLVDREERAELENDCCPLQEGGDPHQHTQRSITTWEAGWNITNAIQGVCVLGLPYALLQSGFLGLVLLVLSACVCSYTGKILISCLYEEDEQGHVRRIRHTYEDVADTCCPRLGGRLVGAAQLVELTFTCVLYLVIGGNMMSHGLPFLPLTPATSSALTFLTLAPCVVIRDLRVVSRLSFLCSLAQFLLTFIVIVYCLCQCPRWAYGVLALAVDFDHFLVAAGIIIFSYTSQILLPALEGSMAERAEFGSMMDCTHTLAGVLKTAFALLALLTWGHDTKEVVSENLPMALRMMINLCLLTKSLLSYPLPFYAAAQLLHTDVARSGIARDGWGGAGGGAEWHVLLLRGSLLCLTFVMAACVPHISLLMGLTGSVTGATMTLLLPALFHLRLKWAGLGWGGRVLDSLILALGVLCTVAGIIYSVRGVLEALGNR